MGEEFINNRIYVYLLRREECGSSHGPLEHRDMQITPSYAQHDCKHRQCLTTDTNEWLCVCSLLLYTWELYGTVT